MRNKRRQSLRRKLRASWRDTWLLLREFFWPLLAFIVAIAGGGLLYYSLARAAGEPVSNHLESMYTVLQMTFLQSGGSFPRAWYLELFYFIMPLTGIGIFAQGVAEFGVMLFNRRERGKEWEMAVASTLSHHVILVGLGHLGYRVAQNLSQMEQDVVVVERNPSADLVASVRQWGIPVLQQDAVREETLEAAGIRRARSIILCTQNDSLNLQIALKARNLNPKIDVIVRIFDEEFASALQKQFGFTAMSATGMAAPTFAASAAGVDLTRPISIEGRALSLARLAISAASLVAGKHVGEVEQRYDLSVVLLRHDGNSDLHPDANCLVQAGDVLAVLGGPAEINLLMRDNTSVE